ncbi:MAG: amidohydrolase family protein [Cytophagales bacterium]
MPHIQKKKNQDKYINAPSGGPLIQYSLPVLLEMNRKNKISLEKIVEKTSHNVADLFQIKERGYIREGYFADIVLFDLDSKTDVNENNVLSKCKWSPFEDTSFNSKVIHTIVSGNHIYNNGVINGEPSGIRMVFIRD